MRQRKIGEYVFVSPVDAEEIERLLDYASDQTGVFEMKIVSKPGDRVYKPKTSKKVTYQQPSFTAHIRKYNVPVTAKAVPVRQKDRKDYRDNNAFTVLKFYGISDSAEHIAVEIVERIKFRRLQDIQEGRVLVENTN